MLTEWERDYIRAVLGGAEKTRMYINVIADSCYYVRHDEIKYLRAKESWKYFCENPTEVIPIEETDGLGRTHIWDLS